MDRLKNSFMSIEQAKDAYFNQTNYSSGKDNVEQSGSELDFRKILERAGEKNFDELNSQGVCFSKHANERLESRNINLSEEQITRLNKGIMQAKEKSINESLVMMDNIAFIVNVKNNTVITAVEQEIENGNVFTNIDGAVIV